MKNNWADFVPVSIRETDSAYVMYEPLSVGSYTLHFWRVSSMGNAQPQKGNRALDEVVRYIHVQSYLPDHTVPGLVLPKFTLSNFKKSKSATPHGCSPVYLRGRTTSTPTSVWLQSVQQTYIHPPLMKTHSFHSGSHLFNIQDDCTVWQLNIYKNGQYIDPSRDSELKEFSWAKKSVVDWTNKTFTKSELIELIMDIYSLFEEKKVSQDDICRLISIRPDGADVSGNLWAF